MTKLLSLAVLFLTSVGAVVLAKLEFLAIFPLTLYILALRAAVVVTLIILGISPLTSFILALRVVSVPKLVISVFYLQYVLS